MALPISPLYTYYMRVLNFVVSTLVAVSLSTVAIAQEYDYSYGQPSKKPEGGPRAQHWSGFDIGLGMPFPSFAGGMIGFNFGDEARLSGGVGTLGKWTTYQLDTKVFLGKAAWAGYFGAGVDYIYGTPGKIGPYDLDFAAKWVPYIQFGVDYQSDIGLHLMFNLAGAVPEGEILIWPGLAIGWYF